MALTITVDDRDFDVVNVTRCLVLPASREYVGHLETDSPDDASTTYEGDVQVIGIDQVDHTLTVAPFIEAVGESERDKAFTVNIADIRKISFY